jgi:hypothetical protein
MALAKMPNGAYVDIPDDITPQGMARLTARYGGAPATTFKASTPAPTRPAPKAPDDTEQRIEQLTRKSKPGIGGAMDAFKDNAVHNMTFGLDDVVGPAMSAATEGGIRAIQRGDIGEVGKQYSVARQANRRSRASAQEEHPIASGGGGLVGVLTGPLGAETGAKALATKVAPQLTEKVLKSAAGRAIAKVGSSSIGTGARAGFNQGFVTGLTDTGDVGDAANQGLIGGVAGGAASALVRGAQGVHRVVQDYAPKNAPRVAYDKIAQMLAKSEDPLTRQPFTPASIRAEIKATDHGGGEAMVADLMPEGQGWASYLAKQPGNTAASHLINTSEERLASSPDRFDERVRKVLKIGKGDPDAYDSTKAIEAARKAHAQAGYTDDVMDKQLAWNDQLDKFFKKDNPYVKDALTKAEKLIRGEDGDVTQLAFTNSKNPGAGMMQNVPSMNVLDKVKKGFDSQIGEALRVGDKEGARMYSIQLRHLKDAVADANPEYAAVLKGQRDFYERADSTQLGLDVLNNLKSGKSREVLDQIKAAKNPDDVKIGFADALMHLREKGGNPVVVMRKFMRSTDQRKVLAHMFGGNATLNEFERFMRREMRGLETDAMVTSGRQMQRDLLKDPPTGGAGEAATEIAKSGAQGAAFGGPLGLLSRTTRSIDTLRKNVSPAAKGEIARIISGKGDDLEAGIAKAKKHRLDMLRNNRRAAVAAGKVPGMSLNGYAEQ